MFIARRSPLSMKAVYGILRPLCLLALMNSLPASGAIFRCVDSQGTTYSDTPCGPSAKQIQVPDNRIGGSFGQGVIPSEPPLEKPLPTPAPKAESPCKSFLSTDLRHYIIGKDIVPGMNAEDVRKSLGSPARIESGWEETWVYTDIYHGYIIESQRIVFRENCVVRVEKIGPQFR